MIGWLILVLVIWFIVWIISKVKRPLPDSVSEDTSEKDRYYLEKMEKIKLHAQEELHEQELEHRESIKSYRQDSVKRSRSSLTGKIMEQICSMFPNFKWHPADMRFLGSPVDYVIFKNMNKQSIDKIIFLEVKTGDAKLTKLQEQIKRAVKAGRVEWKEYRI